MEDSPPPSGTAALDRALDLFLAVLADQGRSTPTDLAARLGLPGSTAYRLLHPFLARGLLMKSAPGRYGAGAALGVAAGVETSEQAIARLARPSLAALAQRLGATAHLGVLEGDMVTYLAKAEGGGPALFTREGIQLEAYCSGIGKVLLAHLPADAQDAYLAGGPFVALTAHTLTDPERMRAEWRRIKAQGFGVDAEEIIPGLICLAAPVQAPDGSVRLAVSASFATTGGAEKKRLERALPHLRATAAAISRFLIASEANSL
jgi:IclR family transcriptional regulator, acetate operon repressor